LEQRSCNSLRELYAYPRKKKNAQIQSLCHQIWRLEIPSIPYINPQFAFLAPKKKHKCISASARMWPASARTRKIKNKISASAQTEFLIFNLFFPVRTDVVMGPHRQGPHPHRCTSCPCRRNSCRRGRGDLSRGNFIMDATVHLSHGWPSSHRPCPRPSIRLSVLVRPLDNYAWWVLPSSTIITRDLLTMVSRPWWIFPPCPMILKIVLDCDGYYQVLQVLTRDLLSLNSRAWWVFLLCPVILYVVLDCDRYFFVYVTLCSCMFLTVWQDCVFSFILFCFVCFVGLMDMSSMEED
jgi:hypothetical protein